MQMRRVMLVVAYLSVLVGLGAHACSVTPYAVTPETGSQVASVVVAAIRGAATSLDIVAPVFPFASIGGAVVDAIARGVTVRVILDGEGGQPPSNSSWLVTHDAAIALENTTARLEHQFIVVDGRRAIVGPFPWLEQAPQVAYLDLLVIDCRPGQGGGTTADWYARTFDRLWASLAVAGPLSTPPPVLHAVPQSVLIFHVDAAGECIELINRSAISVDISGWTISDLEGNYAFPDETILEPGDPFQICIATYNPTADPQELFLNDEHDELFLSTPEGEIVDEVIW